MYAVLLGLQYIGSLALILELYYISRKRSSKLQTYLLLLMGVTLLNVVGYTLEMQSRDLELALQSVKIVYLGKPFIVYLMYLFVMEYCGVKIPQLWKNICFGICIAVVFLVFTSPYQHLFYTSFTFTNSGLFPHIILKHGIVYNLYTLLLGYYFLAVIWVCVKKYRQNTSELIRKQVTFLLALVSICMVSLVLFLLDLTGGYDTTTMGYLLAVVIFNRLLIKYRLFDTLTLAKDEAIDHMTNGLIVIDLYGNMVYSNRKAENILEILTKEHPAAVTYLLEAAKQSKPLFLNECMEKEMHHHGEKEKCVYELTLREIHHHDKSYGKMLVMTEITDRYYYTERLQDEVQKKTKEVVVIQRNIIGSFATMMEARDGITGLHIKNTSALVKILVHRMQEEKAYKNQITQEYAEMVADAAHLHDIGKIAIPDRILQKEGKLTEEEFAIMKSHPQEGADILKNTIQGLESDAYYQIAHDMTLYHHEKYDGSGYPTGIRGEQIPLSARIMAVADVYDALRSKRHYKEGFSKEKSMEIIRENSGSQFDPAIASLFLEHIDEMEEVLVFEN